MARGLSEGGKMTMGTSAGWGMFLAGLVLSGYGLALVAAPIGLPSGAWAAESAGAAGLGVGLLLVVVGLFAMTRRRPAPPPAAPAPVAPETVEIKRTEMAWGEGAASAAGESPSAELEEVRRRMANLKVQYGLGQVSAEAYRRLMGELEAQEAGLLRGELVGRG